MSERSKSGNIRQPMQVSPDVNAASMHEMHGGPADGMKFRTPLDHIVIMAWKVSGEIAAVSLPRLVPLGNGDVSDQIALNQSMGSYRGHYEHVNGRFEFRDEHTTHV